MQEVIKYCNTHNINITSQQALILEIIVLNAGAITANEILQKLKENNPKANRMTIHRSLDYLVKANLIHRITFNLTYKLCNHLSTHICQILICQQCGYQIELHLDHIQEALAAASKNYCFEISNPIEITGLCKKCLSQAKN